MRNLKRVLSLALAVVMVIGMMVMTTGAADIVDIDEVKNTEAVTVMNALKVLEGDENGVFNPTGILTREQAAKIICYMMMGPENAEMLTGTSSFTDVAATRWSAPFISYCNSLGIISGYDGKFDPTGELTGVAFAKMLLVALGYDAEIEGYVNNANWATNIGTDAIDAGINIKGVDLALAVSRDNAAQMAFNTLTANMVAYADKGTDITMSDGTSIKVGASDAAAVTVAGEAGANYAGAGALNGSVGTKQFCEKYFAELRKDGAYTDDFGRAASYSWYLDKNLNDTQDLNEQGVYDAMRTPAVTFTDDAAGPKIANMLKGYTFNGTKLTAPNTTITTGYTAGDVTFANGDNIANVIAGYTADGAVVEIYATSSKAVNDIQVVVCAKETITNVTTNTAGDVTYTLSSSGAKVDKAEGTADDTVILHGDFARGDIVTTVLGLSTKLHVYPTTSFTGKMTAYSTTEGTITVDGTVYTVADGIGNVVTGDFYTNTLLNQAVIVTVDEFDNAVAIEAVEAAYDNYAQVKGTVVTKLSTTVDGTTPSVEARFVLADGTVATYKVKLTKAGPTNYKLLDTIVYTGVENNTTLGINVSALLADGTAFAYELDGTTIDLKAIVTSSSTVGADIQGTDATITTGATSVTMDGKTVLLTSNTTYVLYDGMKKSATVYEGALPAGAVLDAGAQVIATVNSNNAYATAQVVFGLASDVAAPSTGNYAYVVSSDVTVVKIGNSAYNTYEAYMADGTIITLYDKQGSTQVGGDGVYTWDADCNVTGVYTGGGTVQAEATYNVVGDQIVGGGNAYNVANANIIYTKKNLNTMDGKVCVVVVTKENGTLTKNAETVFVVG